MRLWRRKKAKEGTYRELFENLVKNLAASIPKHDTYIKYERYARLLGPAIGALEPPRNVFAKEVLDLRRYYKSKEFDKLLASIDSWDKEMAKVDKAIKVLEKALEKGKLGPGYKEAAEALVAVFVKWRNEYSMRYLSSLNVYNYLTAQKELFLKGDDRGYDNFLANRKSMIDEVVHPLRNLLWDLWQKIGKLESPAKLKKRMTTVRGRVTFGLWASVATMLFIFGISLTSSERRFLDYYEAASVSADVIFRDPVETHLEEKYGINLAGHFTHNDLIMLERSLVHYTAEDFKQFGTRRIFFTPETSLRPKGKGDWCGMAFAKFHSYVKKIWLRPGEVTKKVVDHELAHHRHFTIHYGTDGKFNEEWLKACGEFNVYDKVYEGDDGLFYYKGLPKDKRKSLRFGYICAYGGKNIWEDVAEFVEEIKNGHVNISYNLTENFDIYIAKVNLLGKYGFITPEETKSVLQSIENMKSMHPEYSS